MAQFNINPDINVGYGFTLGGLAKSLYQTGYVITSGTKEAHAKYNQDNIVQTLNIPKGIWLVFGHWLYKGENLSSWTEFFGINFGDSIGTYDDRGWCSMSITGLSVSDGTQVAQLNLWPRNKEVDVEAYIWAIKISNN